MNALEKGLYAKLTGSNELGAMLATPISVFAYSAPENAAEPLIVFFEQVGTPEYTYAQRIADQWLYGVKAITRDSSMHAAGEIDEAIDSLLTDSDFTIDDGTVMYCRRESAIPKYSEITDGVRYNHAGGSYRIWTTA